MSGRGKGGKGLGKGSEERPGKWTKRDMAIEWEAGQEAVVVSYITPCDMSCANRHLPMEELHPRVKAAVLGSSDPVPEFEWNLDEENIMETLFEHLQPQSDEDDDDEDEELDHDEVVEDIEEWAKELKRSPAPDVAVKVRARVCIFRDA